MTFSKISTSARGLLVLCAMATSACAGAHKPEPQSAPPVPDAPAASAPGTGPTVIEIRVAFVSEAARSHADALARAQMLSSMAKGGDKLIDLVPKYGDRLEGASDFGTFLVKPAQPAPFDAGVVSAALALPVGSVSDPVQINGGYVVIERLKDPPAGPERIAAKHILISYATAPHALPGATHSEAEARALAEQVVREAHAPNADWDALAAKYTEEPGGKERAGDLGKFGHGQMVPAFEQAAFALDVGQISDVVQSPFGFHVIKRYE
ncbi:MAG TPA: peptidylprolyl isomerase [Polyangiales bacterium]|nr:peptidylprolyl isomerase [Polyangiales bacterium]